MATHGPNARQFDIGLLDFVGQSSGGLIELGPQASDDGVLIQLRLFFPQKRILVLCDSRHDGQELQHYVTKNSPSTVRSGIRSLNASSANDDSAKMLFGTFFDSLDLQSELETVDMILAVRAREITKYERRLAINHFSRAKRFGFIRAQEGLSQFEQDWAQAYFGFDRLRICQHGLPQRCVNLRKVSVGDKVRFERPESATQLHRRYVVHHRARNTAIAKSARKFGDAGTLLIAADPTHAKILHSALSNWELFLTNSDREEASLKRKLESCQERRCGGIGILPNAIVPIRDVELMRLSHYETVINASATQGMSSSLLDRLDVGCRKTPTSLCLVDFDDRHHPELRRDATARWDAYLGRGWTKEGVDPKTAAIERFLRGRPKR